VLGAEPPIEVLVASQLASHSAEAPRGVASELDLDPDSLALVQFSSGSTSAPKPVALTHRQLVAQLATLHMLMPEVTAGVSWLPLFHDMGLVGCLLSAAYYPAPLTLLRPEAFLARPALWLRALSRTRAEVSPAPNFAFGLCLKRVRDEELEGVDLSSWRYALNGAEPVSPPLLRRFAERFAPFGLAPEALVPVYGLAEAALAVTFSPRRPQVRALALDPRLLALHGRVVPGPREVSSVGLPVPGVEIELRDDTGTPLPERQVGRVTVRGPSVMAHYLGLPEATAEVLRDGWLDTGDLGFAEGGELFICGRSKDVIVIRGANHDPQEFEEAVDAVPGLRAGCAVAVGFEPAGEEAEALLMLVERAKDGAAVASETLAEQVKTAVLERSGIRPHTVELLAPGSLPRTSSGKLRRREALRRYLAAELVAAPLSRGQIALQVAKGAAALWLRGKVSRP
jgi:fatty-acyl-CoA synthase